MKEQMVDEKDLKILAILKDNSKLTTNKISKKLRIPVTTVHNRIKKLEKLGVIEKYTLKINQKLIGKNITAYIFIKIKNIASEKNTNPQEIIRKIKNIHSVESVELITGPYDAIAKASVSNVDELNILVTHDIRTNEYVERTETAIILKTIY